MRAKAFIPLVFAAHLACCQPVASFDRRIVEEVTSVCILYAPFMIDELVEIYKRDSLIVRRTFNREVFNRTEYTLYCYNVLAHFFYSRLIESRNNENRGVVDRIIAELDYDKNHVKPDIDWGRVFETCDTCPFGEYPRDDVFYFMFSITHKSEAEIREMIKFEDGAQWQYMLEDIKYGDHFTLSKDENYVRYVLDRRVARHIIERWQDSDIPEVQALIAVYRSVM